MLLDSDCLPVTLFEVEDLWTEAFLARFPVHSDVGVTCHLCSKAAFTEEFLRNANLLSSVSSTRMGQGVLVVTEPHSEFADKE